jgi:hypothetical protein
VPSIAKKHRWPQATVTQARLEDVLRRTKALRCPVPTIAALARELGLNEKKLRIDIWKYPLFKDRITECLRSGIVDQRTGPREVFLAEFSKTADRLAACEAAGMTWRQVQMEIDGDPLFADRYKGVWDEHTVRLEDLFRAGKAPAGTLAVLRAEFPDRYKGSGSGQKATPAAPRDPAKLADMLAEAMTAARKSAPAGDFEVDDDGMEPS